MARETRLRPDKRHWYFHLRRGYGGQDAAASYFLFSIQSQAAKAAVTMKAGALGHIGNSTALAIIFT